MQVALTYGSDPGQPAMVPENDLEIGTGERLLAPWHLGAVLCCGRLVSVPTNDPGIARVRLVPAANPCSILQPDACCLHPHRTPHCSQRPPPFVAGTYIHYGKAAAILRSYELYLKENSGGNKDALRSVLTVRSAWWLQRCMAELGALRANCAAIAVPSPLTAPVAQLFNFP